MSELTRRGFFKLMMIGAGAVALAGLPQPTVLDRLLWTEEPPVETPFDDKTALEYLTQAIAKRVDSLCDDANFERFVVTTGEFLLGSTVGRPFLTEDGRLTSEDVVFDSLVSVDLGTDIAKLKNRAELDRWVESASFLLANPLMRRHSQVIAPLMLPRGIEEARLGSAKNMVVRGIRAYDIYRDEFLIRFDILAGTTATGFKERERNRQRHLAAEIRRRLSTPRVKPNLPA